MVSIAFVKCVRTRQEISLIARGWFLTLSKTLHSFKDLKPGWNGYSASPPERLALRNAEQYLCVASHFDLEPTRLAPSAVGGVGITHRRGPLKAYVEFFNNGKVHTLFSDDEKKELFTSPVDPTTKGYKSILQGHSKVSQ